MAPRRAKQLRTLAEVHYDKSIAAYDHMVRRWKECRSVNQSLHFLRVQLERVAFSEMVIAGGMFSCKSLYSEDLVRRQWSSFQEFRASGMDLH
jgi:hypothetical protein